MATSLKRKRDKVMVSAQSGMLVDSDTGEVIHEKGRTRLVRAYTKSVEQCLSYGVPNERFKLIANRHGQVVQAFGPLALTAVDVSFPGCTTSEEIDLADESLLRAGATRGTSPAGRALDWSLRNNPAIAQWRVERKTMDVFAASLYGGIQLGGDHKPHGRPHRNNKRITLDIVSSYPFLATSPLPRVRDVIIERGYRPHAVLLFISGQQLSPVLFSRTQRGTTTYLEDVHGWYVKDEIDYHVATGRLNVNKVIASATFPHKEKYLARAVDHFFTHREKYPRGTPQRNVLKSGLNGLLGKFASPISSWRSPTRQELSAIRAGDRSMNVLTLGGSMLVQDTRLVDVYPKHCNIIWTSVVYARARVRLWEKMDEIRRAGGTVLWCHTDCVIADVPLDFPVVSNTSLGGWRVVQDDE